MMDLNDLLAEIDGIGADQFVPTKPAGSSTAAPTADMQEDGVPVSEAPMSKPLLSDQTGQTLAQPALSQDALDMVADVEFDVVVELGEARLALNEVLNLQPGDQFLLEQGPSHPLNIFVGDRLVAYGEAVMVDGALAVKILEILSPPFIGSRPGGNV
ncbi:MAG: FliM/FliN family flagellar motor switch protein [Armatimonadota bacterium]